MSLKRDQDIKKVFAKGRSVHGDLVGIKFIANRLPETRFAVAVGTKVAKTAVARNRLKRQIRAILAKYQAKIVVGFDVVVMTKVPAVGKLSKEIEKQLVWILQKAKVLNNG